jgi:hypothetical protein
MPSSSKHNSVLDADPDWIRIPEGNMTHKNREKDVLEVPRCSLLWIDSFFCSFDVLNEGLQIRKLQFIIKCLLNFFTAVF